MILYAVCIYEAIQEHIKTKKLCNSNYLGLQMYQGTKKRGYIGLGQ